MTWNTLKNNIFFVCFLYFVFLPSIPLSLNYSGFCWSKGWWLSQEEMSKSILEELAPRQIAYERIYYNKNDPKVYRKANLEVKFTNFTDEDYFNAIKKMMAENTLVTYKVYYNDKTHDVIPYKNKNVFKSQNVNCCVPLKNLSSVWASIPGNKKFDIRADGPGYDPGFLARILLGNGSIQYAVDIWLSYFDDNNKVQKILSRTYPFMNACGGISHD